MIIERATLRHQLEAAEERKALLRNNLGDHQFWLNNCHENMGRARRQVHQLAEQTSYFIKNHRRMNDPEVAVQARAIVPHLLKVWLNLYETLGGQRKPQKEHSYFTRSKVRASMTSNTETVVNPVDTPIDSTTRESTTVEKNRTLRHVMAQLWQAWANGQEPPTSIPGFLEITSIRSSSSQVPISDPFFPPG
ncbi:hypothetical protein MTR67_038781 [Solanum verrucosum]|uniref:Uncharacterized protein n=1 Tax=Solanum verrucosum TaxID=315347 RepID=A0AAF0UGW2_SOLVR|nr:hypothetical protein MTR67_038781 [Solanum verrucosum]